MSEITQFEKRHRLVINQFIYIMNDKLLSMEEKLKLFEMMHEKSSESINLYKTMIKLTINGK